MLVLLLLLHWAWGALGTFPPLPPGSVTLRLLYTAVFHSASSTDMQVGMALLGDFRTHSLNCNTCKIRFLQPWAQRGLTPKEWQDLEAVIHRSLLDFNHLVNKVVKQEELGYPFVIQASIGCQLHPNSTSRGFCDAAVNGDHVMSFNVDAGIWVPQLQHKVLLYVQDLLTQDRGTTIMLQLLLRTTCVNEIKSFFQYGKESLQRQERPLAVVFARAPPPAKTPELLLLVCWVTGFYPRPIRVAWLQDGEEVAPSWRLNSTEILPNADLTYQLRSSLAVEPGNGHSYACRVDHSSLGDQSLLIPWGHSRRWVPGLIVGVTLGGLAVAAMAVVLWQRRRRGYQDNQPAEYRSRGGNTSPGLSIGPSSGDMDLRDQSTPSSRSEGPESQSAAEH